MSYVAGLTQQVLGAFRRLHMACQQELGLADVSRYVHYTLCGRSTPWYVLSGGPPLHSQWLQRRPTLMANHLSAIVDVTWSDDEILIDMACAARVVEGVDLILSHTPSDDTDADIAQLISIDPTTSTWQAIICEIGAAALGYQA